MALFEAVLDHTAFHEDLSLEQQQTIIKGYETLKHRNGLPSLSLSLLGLTWAFASVASSLLLLFRVEGAKLASWILPLIVLAFGILIPRPAINDSLFPEEKEVLQYADPSHLSKKNWVDKKSQLLTAWQRYLIAEWAKETPQEDRELFKKQYEKGLFAFNIARINALLEGKPFVDFFTYLFLPPGALILTGYFLWNLFFAIFMNRKKAFECF